MERHQHAVVKILSHLGQAGIYNFSQTRASHNKPHGYGRGRLTFLDETIFVTSSWFQFFFSDNIEQHECCVNFWNLSGFIWTFVCINWPFNAFMCIIQIWTTCTCSSAYKFVENSKFFPWLHAYIPCKKYEWMSNTLPSSLSSKHWDTWFLNSSKSKTRLKFMNLDTLAWNGINMQW